MGMRRSAIPLRDRIEQAIASGSDVAIDFSGMEATQSFVDELVGVLVLSHGPAVLDRVAFKGCSSTVKAIVRFVVTDRAKQFIKKTH